MPGVKSLKHLSKDQTGYSAGETVHDFITAQKVIIREIVNTGNRQHYRVQFADKTFGIRNRDDLDVA